MPKTFFAVMLVFASLAVAQNPQIKSCPKGLLRFLQADPDNSWTVYFTALRVLGRDLTDQEWRDLEDVPSLKLSSPAKLAFWQLMVALPRTKQRHDLIERMPPFYPKGREFLVVKEPEPVQSRGIHGRRNRRFWDPPPATVPVPLTRTTVPGPGATQQR